VGHCSYIINCAGVLDAGFLDNNKIKNLEYSINVNAIAPIMIINNFLEKMKENNFGRIINLTSGAPLNCYPGFSLYSTSKAALNSLTTTLAREVENYNISINLMSPGPVKSEMSPDALIDAIVCLPTIKYLLDGNGKNQHQFFYWLGYKVPLFPDLDGINWLEGIGNEKIEKVVF
ncbi:SDR family oxidoreductase, partial [Acinetobacter baumannii]